MMGRRIIWSILLTGALGLYLFANSAATLCVLLAALLPLLSAVLLLLPRQVKLTLCGPETVTRSAEVACTLTVSSHGIPAQFAITIEAENCFTGERSAQVMQIFAGKEPVQLSWQLDGTHSGAVCISCACVRELDGFGLFSRKRSCEARADVVIPAQTFPVSIELDQAAEILLDSELYSSQRAGSDPGETFRIREYVPGDPIRQIHWKLSEKTGTLMVREFGLPATNRLLLAFLPERSLPPEQLDVMLDTLVSVSLELLRQDIQYTLLYDGELYKITDTAELTQMMTQLLHRAPECEKTEAFFQENALSYAHIALIAARAVPAAEDLAQTCCVSVLFQDSAALPENTETGRVRIHAFRADALRAGMLHFEL